MWLQARLYLLLGAMFAIVYAVIVVGASAIGISGLMFYVLLAVGLLFIQYMIGPKLVEFSMRVKYVTEAEYPKLHAMVSELADAAGIPKPKVGVSPAPIPNAFAFGRSRSDGRVCVTEQITRLLSEKELRAVIGHEISHLKNRDVTVITMLSVVPMILWYVAWSFMFSRRSQGNTVLLGIGAFVLYFITNLLVLYGSRIREYYADLGSVKLGNAPHHMATALYKLVYGSARVPKESLKQMEGYKAFFASDPSRAMTELKELKQVDLDMSGTIDQGELMALRGQEVRISGSDKLMEIMSTHPNMVKRVKHLSELT
ncbi:MAG: M48 family metalloprotease [Deltaproteobacteria bacterium]|nr:MAG: M48 family metalloprotease [Deltaproteobacteria bacterium]